MKMFMTAMYDSNDMRALKSLDTDEVIKILMEIHRGYLEQLDYVTEVLDGDEFTESQYESTRLHEGIWRAIELLRKGKESKDER